MVTLLTAEKTLLFHLARTGMLCSHMSDVLFLLQMFCAVEILLLQLDSLRIKDHLSLQMPLRSMQAIPTGCVNTSCIQ